MATLKIAYPGGRDSFIRFREDRLVGTAKVKRRVSDRKAIMLALARLKLTAHLSGVVGASATPIPDQPLIDQSGYSAAHQNLLKRAGRTPKVKGSTQPAVLNLLALFSTGPNGSK